MFIGKYEIDGQKKFNIYYYKNTNKYRNNEWKKWLEDTFSGVCNIETLDFKISGKTYEEKKASLEELAKDWQLHFSCLSWSYSELYEIQNWLYENAKRYGLVKVFHENAIC